MNQPAPPPQIKAQVDKGVVLWVTCVASFLAPFMGSSINVAIPSIGVEFAMDAISLSWVVTSYLLATAMFLVPLGRLADIHGRKRVFLYGIAVYTISSLLCAVATSPTLLIGFRVVQGIGSAMVFGTSMAILTSVYPPQQRGRALGINVASVYIGLAIGPSIGGLLTQHLGWRSVFALNVPLGIIIAALILWKLRGEWAEARGERFDIVGSIIYAVTLLAVMYGFSRLPDASGAWLIALGLLCLVGFVIWEGRVPNPVLNTKLFSQNPVFAFSNLAALINYSATSAVAFLLSLYLQYIKGLDPQSAGLVLLSQPIIMFIFSPLAGRLSDRVEPRLVASTGMLLTAIGLGLMTFVNGSTSLTFIVAALVICGLGFALFSSPNSNAIMSSVQRGYYGVASATLGAMRLIGQMLSMGIATLILAVIVGSVQITPANYPAFLDSVRFAFILFAVLCFGGVIASLARGNLREGVASGPGGSLRPPTAR